MGRFERRSARRLHICIPLRLHRQNEISEGEYGATSVNVSSNGVYFLTSLSLLVGETVEVLASLPKRVTGEKISKRLFTGKVTHVESRNGTDGISGVGVHLLYYISESCLEWPEHVLTVPL